MRRRGQTTAATQVVVMTVMVIQSVCRRHASRRRRSIGATGRAAPTTTATPAGTAPRAEGAAEVREIQRCGC